MRRGLSNNLFHHAPPGVRCVVCDVMLFTFVEHASGFALGAQRPHRRGRWRVSIPSGPAESRRCSGGMLRQSPPIQESAHGRRPCNVHSYSKFLACSRSHVGLVRTVCGALPCTVDAMGSAPRDLAPVHGFLRRLTKDRIAYFNARMHAEILVSFSRACLCYRVSYCGAP